MQSRVLLFCGIIASILYAAAVGVGGALWPGYSHIARAVSDLVSTGAPNKALLELLFALYNVGVGAFALGMLLTLRTFAGEVGRRVGLAGSLSLIAEAAFGLLTLLVPEPAGGMSAAMTSTGAMHIVFAGLSSLATMISMVLIGIWFRRAPALSGLAAYSFVSVAVVFVSGALGAVAVGSGSSLAGLVERITIGGFIQWLFVVSIVLSTIHRTLAGRGAY